MQVKLLFGALMFAAISANAQVATINENFESFVIAPTAAWPQNGWSKVVGTGMAPRIYADGTTDKYAQFYTFFSPGVAGYLVTPQIIAPNGTKSLKFNYALTEGSAGSGTLEVGLISESSTVGTDNFTSISQIYTVTSGTEQTVTITVPASSKQYIAFKFTGTVAHAAILVDDVMYDNTAVLATSDIKKSNDAIKFAVNTEDTGLVFVGKEAPKSVEIYSAAGTRAAAGTVDNGRFNISSLQTGVYYILIQNKDGKTQKSKFIKK